ncbi:hypothetical protein GX48_02603 [Paracoccidioides brasiliensis]|nr:hypothetical protein GX48_02603 [Paracoccidioides brasiliensis]
MAPESAAHPRTSGAELRDRPDRAHTTWAPGISANEGLLDAAAAEYFINTYPIWDSGLRPLLERFSKPAMCYAAIMIISGNYSTSNDMHNIRHITMGGSVVDASTQRLNLDKSWLAETRLSEQGCN